MGAEIFTISCPICQSYTAGYMLNGAKDEEMADIGRAAVLAAQMGLRIGVLPDAAGGNQQCARRGAVA